MTTLTDAISAYLVQLEADGRSQHTRAQVARHTRLLAAWLGNAREVDALTPELIAQFLASPAARTTPDGKPKRASSMNALRTSIRCLGRYLHDAGLVNANPARLVRRARCSPPPPRPMRQDEIERLLQAMAREPGRAARRDHAMFLLMAGTGIRVGTAVALRVDDLDLDEGVLVLRTMKGGRAGQVFVPRSLITTLREFVGTRTDGALFPADHGGGMTTRSVSSRLARWAKRAGLLGACGPHRLRHSFGQRLLEQTGDLALVQKAMTHRSIASTMAYVQVADARLRAAVGG